MAERYAVTFREAWFWVALWLVIDIACYVFSDHLWSWLADTSGRKISRDFDIAFFIAGLWLFARFTTEERAP